MAHIEHHPENGDSPWVVVSKANGKSLWFAYRTEDKAKQMLPGINIFEGEQWTRAQIEQFARP